MLPLSLSTPAAKSYWTTGGRRTATSRPRDLIVAAPAELRVLEDPAAKGRKTATTRPRGLMSAAPAGSRRTPGNSVSPGISPRGDGVEGLVIVNGRGTPDNSSPPVVSVPSVAEDVDDASAERRGRRTTHHRRSSPFPMPRPSPFFLKARCRCRR